MFVEQVMRRGALAGFDQPDQLYQHFRIRIAGIGAIRTALQLMRQEDTAVAAQDRDLAHAAVSHQVLQRRELVEAGPFLVLDHFARRIIRDDADNPSCKMVKHEEWPGLDKLTALKNLMADGSMRKVAILCGNGGIFLPHELERGADGANTGYAYPEMLVQLVRLIKSGERAAAHDLFDKHLPLLRYEQQPGMPGLAVRKYILKRRGAIASDAQRKPGVKLSKESIAEIEFLIARLERNN